ncbi:MAG: alpha/beta hydrolase [Acidobacteriota bacterium]|nr:alpha/beta hydrolase [Acidobacteriota bacterium]
MSRYCLVSLVALFILTVGLCPTAVAQTAHPSFDVKVTGQGPAIVLIPGLLSAGEVWDSTVERYKGRHTLHVLTLAGFGGPAPVGAPFLSRVRDEVIVYLREQTIQKAVIVGHSLGGFLAFWIGATAPDLVGGIVAVDGVPFLPALGNASASVESTKGQADQIKAIYASLSTEQLVAQSRMAMRTMITAPADVERAVAWVAKSDAKTTGLAVAEIMATDLRNDVAAISVPTLLIAALGGAPEAMRPTMAKSYTAQVSRIKSSRVVMAEKARHFIMFDDPSFLFSTLDEFLASYRQSAKN